MLSVTGLGIVAAQCKTEIEKNPACYRHTVQKAIIRDCMEVH